MPVGGDLDGAGLETFRDYTILNLPSQDTGPVRSTKLEADLAFTEPPGRRDPDGLSPGHAAPQAVFSPRRPVFGEDKAVELGYAAVSQGFYDSGNLGSRIHQPMAAVREADQRGVGGGQAQQQYF